MSKKNLSDRLFVSNPDAWVEACKKKYFSDRELTVKTVERGVVLPARPVQASDLFKNYGGVCDENLNFVDGHNDVVDEPWEGHYVLNGAYHVKPDEILETNDDVIYGGAMIYHFGHFMIETLSRMWFVIQHPELRLKIVFVELKVIDIQVLRSWVNKLFDLLGISDDRIAIITQPMRFRSIIVPEQAIYFRDHFSKEFLIPYRAMLSRIRSASARKIFLSRSADVVSIVHLCNQEYFEEFYRRHGFEIVYPEKLAISDQIALISGADEIVTYLGTLSHWALFCKPGTKFTILLRVDETPDLIQTMVRQSIINEASKIDWRMVSVERNFLAAAHGVGVCLIGPTEYWEQYVREQFDEHVDGDESIPMEIVDEYINRWCRFTEPMFKTRVDTIKMLHTKNRALNIKLEQGRPALYCQVQQEQVGRLFPALEGDIIGLVRQPLGIQTLRFFFVRDFCNVVYSVCHLDGDWEEFKSNGETAGGDDEKLICGVSISLDSKKFGVQYRVHVLGGWSDWASDGHRVSANYAINALQFKVVPLENKKSGKSAKGEG